MRISLRWVSLVLLFCLLNDAKGADLRLSIDHFSRTITARDTAYYWVEVFAKGNKAIAVNLRAQSEADSVLNIQFPKIQTTQVITPALVRLKVSARNEKHVRRHRLFIIASGADTAVILQAWLNIVEATEQSHKLVVDVPPSGQLDKNLPQSMEGRAIPAKPAASIKVNLISPSQKMTILKTKGDENGLYHINHVFSEHGRWQAVAVWQRQNATSGPDSVIAEPIFFDVKRSPFRLTVSTEDSFRYRKDPKTLRVLGQITPDYARGAKITISVTAPDRKKESIIVLPDISSGKFSADFQAGSSGIYQIEAAADTTNVILDSYGSSDKISKQLLYASTAPASIFLAPPPANCTAGSSSHSITLSSTQPAGYAVIVVGDSPDYYHHLSMANRVRDVLIKSRGFRQEDILLETFYDGFGAPKTLAQLSDAIKNFLIRDVKANLTNFDNHCGLLFFWIGNTFSSGPFAGQFAAHAGLNLSAAQIKSTYTTALNQPDPFDPNKRLWSRYTGTTSNGFNRGIIFIHAGDNSGTLLNALQLTSGDFTLPQGSAFNVYAISSLPNVAAKTENYSTLCGLTTFSFHFLSAIEANYNVLCAFHSAWGVKSGDPEINSDINSDTIGSFETDAAIDNFGNITSASILGYKRSPTQLTAGAREVFGSIVGSPVLGPERTVFVALDNPNKYPIRGVTLLVEPPKTTSQPDQPNLRMQPDQCFMLQPVDSSSLWKAEVDVFKNKGLYRGSIFVEYEALDRLQVATAFFERFRYDTTSVPTVVPPEDSTPSVFFDPHIETGFNFSRGFDPGSVRDSQNKPSGVIDVNFYSTRGGNLEFLGLGVASNFDRFWGMLMPISVSAGGTKVLSNLWIYGGFGYELGHAKLIQEDFLYFVGLKYRLFSLKH